MTEVKKRRKTWWFIEWLRHLFGIDHSINLGSREVTDCESLETMLSHSNQNHDNIKALHMKHTEIRSIPQNIGLIDTLVTLNLSHNCIESLPWSIVYLRSLQDLDLSHNRLTDLPHTVGYLTCLKTLHLEYNILKILPSCLLKLTLLKEIRAVGNPLISPPVKVCRQGKEAIFQALRIRDKRHNLWHTNFPGPSTRASNQPLSLSELCIQCILENDVGFLICRQTPPKLKMELMGYKDVQDSVVNVMKCSACRKFFSNKQYFYSHACGPVRG